MAYDINKVAVLGAGVMGSRIAAYLVEKGLSVLLLDRKPNSLLESEKDEGLDLDDFKVKNRFTLKAIKELSSRKSNEFTDNIEIGNFNDDLYKINDVDWIVEVIIEDIDKKKQLFKKIELYRNEQAVVSSNTSGLSVNEMVKECSDDFKKHFLGIHFFNPPQYLKLLEIIPTRSTSSKVFFYMKQFCEEKLDKGIVVANDTPNFVANRLGTYGVFKSLQVLDRKEFTVGEIDSVTGSLIGRPNTATFKSADMVGIDTLMLVAQYMYNKTTGKEKELFTLPSFIKKMLDENMLGVKSGKGFYKKSGENVLELDVHTLKYKPNTKLDTLGMKSAYKQKDIRERIKVIVYKDDRAGQLVWDIISNTLVYAGNLLGEITENIVAMDNAMKWGFAWEIGIFEIWDAIGVERSITKMREEGKEIPRIAESLLQQGYDTFYKYNSEKIYYFDGEGYKLWTD